MQWISREYKGNTSLKLCPSCGRYFEHEDEEVCERCRKPSVPQIIELEHRQCACGNTFVPFTLEDDTCPECKRKAFSLMSDHEREKIYSKVREFLYDNPLTPKVRVSERFGVPIRFIDDWVIHGKLEEIDEIELKTGPDNICRYCGVKTHSGRICKPCEARLFEKIKSHNDLVKKNTTPARKIGRR